MSGGGLAERVLMLSTLLSLRDQGQGQLSE
jgi:hypothetical protein